MFNTVKLYIIHIHHVEDLTSNMICNLNLELLLDNPIQRIVGYLLPETTQVV